jgi:hypothetical protein
MSIRAVIELSPDLPVAEQERMVAWAYNLSRAGQVVLVLRDVQSSVVDVMLDVAVAAEGLDVNGVIYIDGHNDERVLEFARAAALVVPSSVEFGALLQRCGIVISKSADTHSPPSPQSMVRSRTLERKALR